MSENRTAKKEERSSRIKKSIVLSGLIGTGGLFVAKLLGLVYSIPLSSILGSDAYMSYYGNAYRIYNYILNICTAGFPLAVATVVARYHVKGDYKSLLKIRRLALSILAGLGMVGMIFLMFMAAPIARVMLQNTESNAESVAIMTNLLRLIGVAVFLVPVLSGFRGFYQGLKEMEEYAFSQVFEQFFRVGFMLSVSWLLVYVFNKERKWALYAAVISTSVAALAGIIQYVFFDRKKIKEIEEPAAIQAYDAQSRDVLMKEFLALAIPYLISSIVGYGDDIFNTILLPIGLARKGYDETTRNVILSAVNYVGSKINAIPMILAPGFTAAVIPHISAALAAKNERRVERNIRDCLNIILYIAMPICFCIVIYAPGIYHVLYYTEDLATSSNVLAWNAVEGFLGTLIPVVSTIMMTVGFRRSLLARLSIGAIAKAIVIVPLVSLLGYPGAVLSSIICNGYAGVFNLKEIHDKMNVSFKPIIRIFLKLLLGLGVIFIINRLCNLIGLDAGSGPRLVCLFRLAVNGLLALAGYALFTWWLRIPQKVFHLKRKTKTA